MTEMRYVPLSPALERAGARAAADAEALTQFAADFFRGRAASDITKDDDDEEGGARPT